MADADDYADADPLTEARERAERIKEEEQNHDLLRAADSILEAVRRIESYEEETHGVVPEEPETEPESEE